MFDIVLISLWLKCVNKSFVNTSDDSQPLCFCLFCTKNRNSDDVRSSLRLVYLDDIHIYTVDIFHCT